MSKINNLKIIDLPKINDPRGNLSFFENCNQIPFGIKRTYWIYDVPAGEIIGGHAFEKFEEFIIALSGSFDVVINDGINKNRFLLNKPYVGLHVPCLLWKSLENFSSNALALIVSSIGNNEKDYIRDFELFKKTKENFEK